MLSIGSLYQAMDVKDANKEAAVRMLRKAARMSPDDVSIHSDTWGKYLKSHDSRLSGVTTAAVF